MKRNIKSRALSMVLVFCMIMGMVPMTAQAAETVAPGEFTPSNGGLKYIFGYNITQYANIEVLVRETGKPETEVSLGLIAEEVQVYGEAGSTLGSRDPESSDWIDPSVGVPGKTPKNKFYSNNTSLTKGEYYIHDTGQVDENGDPITAPACETIFEWDGRIDGIPILGPDPTQDDFEVVLIVHTLGDIVEGCTPCTVDSEGNHVHGENYLWTNTDEEWSNPRTVIKVDYQNFLDMAKDALGEDYAKVQLMKEQGVGNDVIKQFIQDCLADNSAPQYLKDLFAEKIADPIYIATGAYGFTYTDLRLEGSLPLTFLRAYNSRYQGGSLGQGFTHGFEYSLRDDNGIIRVIVPGGEEVIFLRLRSGGYDALQGSMYQLADDGSGGYVMTHTSNTRFLFNSVGQLTEIVNPSDVSFATLTYDGGDHLTAIDGVAGSYSLTWTGDHITTVTDNTGRKTEYAYDGDNLISVTNPDNDTLTYSYDSNGFLSAATDFEGEEYICNTYDDLGRVTKQVFINAGQELAATFSYSEQDADGNFTVKIVDYYGSEKTYYYDKHRDLIQIVDENGASSSGYNNFITTSVTDNQNNTTSYEVDNNGNVTKITYPDGGTTSIVYNADNQPITVTDAEGGVERYTYTGGSIATHQDGNGNVTSYSYNSLGLLTTKTDALSNTTTYSYDAKGWLLSITDAEGGVTSYDYDAVGRIVAEHVKINATETATTEYTYSNAGKLLKTKDALGNETSYTYNANGFTTSTTDALGGVTTTEYGTNGQPLKQTDANGNETLYRYETGTGLLESVTDPEGNVTSYSYDSDGQLTETLDPAGNRTEYEYDSLGRLIKTVDALNGETSYEYDSMGRTASTTDANGNKTSYTYDKLGRTIKAVDAEGNETNYQYDRNGNLLKTTDANGNETTTEYNALNYMAKTIDAEGNATTYEYDRVGRIIKVTDALGGVTAYTYDLAGNTLSSTDPNGNMTKYVYDLLGRTVEQINADNSTVKYAYDALGNVIESIDELNGRTGYTYDANGNRLSVTDPLNNVTTYQYNKNNQVTAITYADGGVVRYIYSPLGAVASMTDQNENVTAYTYDALGRQKTVTDGSGIVTKYFYDPVGNTVRTVRDGNPVSQSAYNKVNRVITTQDGLGNAASYTYDGVGNLTAYTDREGNATEYSYNKNYQLVRAKDAMGYTQLTEYDALGRAVKTTNQNNQSTVTTYDANGNVVGITDALSNTVSYTYDSMNRVVSTTDKLGAATTYSYDAAGNLLRATDALGAYSANVYDANGNLTQYTNKENEWVKYEYDSRNRLVKETNQLNHATAYEYDLAGNRTAVIDGNKNRTEYAYDGLNQLVSITNAEGSVTAYVYNYLGSAASMAVDAASGQRATTTYAYDLAGNLTRETSPLGNATSYAYDKEGNVTQKTDENGVVTIYAYDKLYRLTERTDADGTASFTYDGLSNLLTASDNSGTVSFAYDALSRTTQVTNEDGSITGYTYDAAGNRTSITYPDGNVVNTTYDVLGNITALTDYDSTGITYTRDFERRVIKESHSDGSTTEYDYNAAGLMIQQKEVTADNSTRREILYGYDDAGNLASEQRSGIDIDKRDENVRYYYDKANQLVRTVIEGQTRIYAYDLAGNLLSDGEATYTYDLQNRLLTKTGPDGTTTYTYDAAGNLIKEAAPDGTVEYAYTAQNKLAEGKTEDGQSSSYTYNALGVRIQNVQVRENENSGYANADLDGGSENIKDYSKALSDGRATWQRVWESEVGSVHQNDFETVTKHYIVDYLSTANRDILVTEDGSWVARYVYDEGSVRLSAEFSYADGTQRNTTNPNGEYGENPASDIAVNDLSKVWYRTSLLGSTLFAVDESGEVIAHMMYDPWWNPLTETYTDTNFSGLDNLNNFTGYTWDEVLGLYFAQNRFYDAENHRFTQEDIVKDGANWYVYCGNGPTNALDPFGTWTFAVGGEAAAAFLLRLSFGGQLIFDGEGHVGVIVYAGGGGGFPSASFSGTVTITNAPTIGDLAFFGVAGGGSATLPVVVLGGPSVGVEVNSTGQYFGGTVALGAGTSLPEMHGELTFSKIIDITGILKFLGLYDSANQLMNDYYEQLTCDQK